MLYLLLYFCKGKNSFSNSKILPLLFINMFTIKQKICYNTSKVASKLTYAIMT